MDSVWRYEIEFVEADSIGRILTAFLKKCEVSDSGSGI